MPSANVTPVLDYAIPTRRRMSAWLVFVGIVRALSVCASLFAVQLVVQAALLWRAEGGSLGGCGWARMSVRADLEQSFFLLALVFSSQFLPYRVGMLFRLSRFGFYGAAAAWLTLFFWFTSQA